MAWTISIANEKGGVAKTTTTLSLGGAFAEMGNKVLLIDLDPQANLSLSLGVEPAENHRSMINLFLENSPISAVVQPTQVPNLFLLPSNSEIGLSERLIPSKPGYEFLLSHILANVVAEYDFILIDCPPFLGAITLNALMASNLLILPTQAEYYSVYALRNMMGLIRQVRAKGNPGLRYRLLLTMFDKRNRIHRTLSEHLHTTFTNGILNTIIEVDTRLRESPIAGMPIIYHAPKSRSAIQYRNLAQEINQYVQEKSKQPA